MLIWLQRGPILRYSWKVCVTHVHALAVWVVFVSQALNGVLPCPLEHDMLDFQVHGPTRTASSPSLTSISVSIDPFQSVDRNTCCEMLAQRGRWLVAAQDSKKKRKYFSCVMTVMLFERFPDVGPKLRLEARGVSRIVVRG